MNASRSARLLAGWVLILASSAAARAGALSCAGPLAALPVARAVDPSVARRITADLSRLVGATLSENGSPALTPAAANRLLAALTDFAARYGIRLRLAHGAIGVYPAGLYEIELSGLRPLPAGATSVPVAFRHELGHLFHTLQLRAILVESLASGGERLDGERRREAERYLAKLEGGANYRAFEKAVAAAASLVHVLHPSAATAKNYRERLTAILEGTRAGVLSGRVRFPNGTTLEDAYAVLISKAPLIVGTSGKELALRLPFILFAALYAVNPDSAAYGLGGAGDSLGADRDDEGRIRFRSLVHALVRNLTRRISQVSPSLAGG